MLSFIRIVILAKLLDPIFCTINDKCGKLCDKQYIDGISPVNVNRDKQFNVVIIRDGQCWWLMNINHPEKNNYFGKRLNGSVIESMYTVFDDPKSSKKFNLTTLFNSGKSGKVWRIVDNKFQNSFDTIDPLKGLNYNQESRIDAAYVWQPDIQTTILTIFQNDSYYRFNLNNRTQISGPDSLSQDFPYDYERYGKLTGAFSRGHDIYLFHSTGYFIWKTNDGDSGVLSKELSLTKDFYRCVAHSMGRSSNEIEDSDDFREFFVPEDEDIDKLIIRYDSRPLKPPKKAHMPTMATIRSSTGLSNMLNNVHNSINKLSIFDRQHNTTNLTQTHPNTTESTHISLITDVYIRYTNYLDQKIEPDNSQYNASVTKEISEEEDDLDDFVKGPIPTRKNWNTGPKLKPNSSKSGSIGSKILSNKLLITLLIVVSVFKLNIK